MSISIRMSGLGLTPADSGYTGVVKPGGRPAARPRGDAEGEIFWDAPRCTVSAITLQRALLANGLPIGSQVPDGVIGATTKASFRALARRLAAGEPYNVTFARTSATIQYTDRTRNWCEGLATEAARYTGPPGSSGGRGPGTQDTDDEEEPVESTWMTGTNVAIGAVVGGLILWFFWPKKKD